MLALPNVRMLPWIQSSIFSLLKPIHSVFCLDILIGIAVLPFYIRACRRIPRVSQRSVKRLCISLLVTGVFLAVPTMRVVWQDKNGMFAYANLQREVCAVLGLLPYHVVDVVLYLASERRGIGLVERQRIQYFLDKNRKLDASDSKLFGVARRRNLIVIVAESLQAFPIGLEIDGQPVAPRISEFAQESLYFVNFHDQTYLGTTADAELSSFQSLHPLPAGVVAIQYPTNHYRGLPAVLSERGYVTLSAVAEAGGFWNMNQIHPRLGFQRSYFEESFKVQERIGEWLADREFFNQTIPILKAQPEPFMAYLLSSSNHEPWELPEKYRQLKLGNLEGTLLGNYLQSVHYFDKVFGEFIDELRKFGLLDKSVIVLYGDHQAYLGNAPELARILSFPERSQYHHLLVRKKVPLVIRLPRKEGAGERRVAGGHLDIAPTLLSLLGIPNDRSVMLGKDLTLGVNSLVVFRDGSFTDGKHYFVNRYGPTSNSTCYDADTGITIDCALLESERRKALEELEISDLIIRGNVIEALGSVLSITAEKPDE